MRNKKSRPKLCRHDFEGFMYRPGESYSVEEVRESMEHLGREITTQQAEQHIQICNAWTNAAYSRSIRAEEKKSPPKKRLFSLDAAAADNGAADKSIMGWNLWWKQKKDGRINASSGGLYNGVKELREAYESKDVPIRGRAIGVRNSIRSDLEDAGIIAGTIVDDAARMVDLLKITHHYGCQYTSEIQELSVQIPSCDRRAKIEEFADRKYGGLFFLQAVFAKDSLEEMIENLSFMSGVASDRIRISLPKEKKGGKRVMRFSISPYGCLEIHTTRLGAEGRSRGFYIV